MAADCVQYTLGSAHPVGIRLVKNGEARVKASLMIDEAGVLRLVGKLNFANAAPLFPEGEKLIAAGAGPLTIDLSALLQSNSVVLALLICWLRAARRADRDATIRALPSDMANIAEVVGILEFLPVQATGRASGPEDG